MMVYKYDKETGEYLHPFRCQPNPARPGEFLIPPDNTTTQRPPEADQHKAAVINSKKNGWELVPDYRTHEYWLPDGSYHKIETLSEEPPAEALDEPPPPTPEDLANQERAWRNHELSLADRCFTPVFGPVDWTEQQRQEAQITITDYIRQLKTGPNNHPDFPDKTWRPVWPADVPRPAV